MYPLDWTGNHFLDPRIISAVVRKFAASDWNPTRREDRRHAALVALIAKTFGLDPNWIFLVPGSAAGIDALLRSWPATRIVEVVPNYRMVRMIAERDQRAYAAVTQGPGQTLRDALEPYRGAKSVLALTSPANPQGSQIPAEELRELADYWDGPLLVDEAYADFAPYSALPLISLHPNLWVSRSFSKAWGLADLRIGFLVGRTPVPNFADDFLSSLSVNRVATEVARFLLATPEPIKQSVAATCEMRSLLARRLREIGGLDVLDSAANFLTVHCQNVTDTVAWLSSCGLRVKQLTTLRYWPDGWPDGFRVSVPPEPILDQLVDALKALSPNRQ